VLNEQRHSEFLRHHSRDRSGSGAARAEDSSGTPTQSHISPSVPVYEDYRFKADGATEVALRLVRILGKTPACQIR
jgi:hypothetical protein